MSLPRQAQAACSVVFDVGVTGLLRRARQRAALFARLPLHHLLDLLRQLEILVRDAARIVVLQAHLDRGIGRVDIGMMPRRFREMAHRIHHHERAFPPMRLIFAADEPVAEVPARQLRLEARFDLLVVVGLLAGFAFAHGFLPMSRSLRAARLRS